MGFSAFDAGLILFVACLVAMITRRLNLPYTVGLVAAGIALALLPIGLDLPFTPDLVFNAFLPPLIFEAALCLNWRHFRRDLPLTLALAFPGVVLSAIVVATGMHLAVGWSWVGAALFGALIAATDPVSVIATFKETAVPQRLRNVVESESLLNDGFAAVGFVMLVGVAGGSELAPLSIGMSLLWIVVGGVLTGLVVAGVLLLAARGTEDHLVEITLTTLAAYGSFLLAEHFGMSGVLASLSAGLVVANVGWMGSISDVGRGHVLAFWDYVAFLANSAVFILIGSHEGQQPILEYLPAAAIAVGLVLVGRLIAVYPLAGLFRRTRLRINRAYQHVLFWGGLRGALALALALALPKTVVERQEIIVVAFAVVAFSIFVQGLTMPSLIRALSLVRKNSGDEDSNVGDGGVAS